MNAENFKLYRKLLHYHSSLMSMEERRELRFLLKNFFSQHATANLSADDYLFTKLQILDIILNEIGLGKPAIISVLFIVYKRFSAF